MIKNRKEYNSTNKKIRELERALKIADKTTVEMPDFIFQAMVAGIESQIDDMKVEINEYKQLAEANAIPVENLENIGKLLIRARISNKYSQKDLAEKVGVCPQQIQKYEADEYQSTDLKKIVEIAKALGLTLEGMGLLKSKPFKWNIAINRDTFSDKSDKTIVKKVKCSDWALPQSIANYNFRVA